MWYVVGVVTHISMITCTGRFACRLRGVNLIMSTSICSCTPDMSLLCYFQFLNLVLLLKFFTKVTGKGQSTHLVKESLYGYCDYNWSDMRNPMAEFRNTPVIYVAKGGLYQYKVSQRADIRDFAFSNIFTVRIQPGTLTPFHCIIMVVHC